MSDRPNENSSSGIGEAVGFITEFNANVVLFEQITAQLLANTSPDALSDGEITNVRAPTSFLRPLVASC